MAEGALVVCETTVIVVGDMTPAMVGPTTPVDVVVTVNTLREFQLSKKAQRAIITILHGT